jgi:4,5-dihydroxyphthalate decarboxylase
MLLETNELFRRVAQTAEFDVAEMSTCTYMMMHAAGDRRLIGIPVFVSRAFRHNMVFVNGDLGIEEPLHLKGKRVGLAEYQMTAALWVRAFLRHDYGVQPSDIEWLHGGYHTPEQKERWPFDAPPGVAINRIPANTTLHQMFLDGKIDGILTFDPDLYNHLGPRIRRLFPDFRAVEREYARRTGFFPIMHLMVMRRDIYDSDPWIATSLLEAFIRSKRFGIERTGDTITHDDTLPWTKAELDDRFAGDAFAYGFAQNREILEAMTTYAREQHLTDRKLSPEELFAPETLTHPGDDMP